MSSLHIPPVAILTGPTASGKSSLSIEFALSLDPQLEIINADSLLVYQGMDIGTAKPPLSERQGIPHHLIDVCTPDQVFTAGDFVRAATQALEDIHQHGKRALIVGGTGFYLKALLFGLWQAPPANAEIRAQLEELTNDELYFKLKEKDLTSAQRIGESDRYRLVRALEIIELTGKSPTQLQEEVPKKPSSPFHLWIIDRPQAELHTRIAQRTEAMIQEGLIEEVIRVQKSHPQARCLKAVGYQQVVDYLAKRPPSGRKLKPGLEGLSDEIQLATRQLVKQQRTWFRGQSAQFSSSKWFYLEEDRGTLQKEFEALYGRKNI